MRARPFLLIALSLIFLSGMGERPAAQPAPAAVPAPAVAVPPAPAVIPQPPRASLHYREALTREARFHWGLNAPVAVMAGQIHQESAWRPDARSPYANGLAQFTPQTAEWIAGAYQHYLQGADAFNPQWSIRALVIYDKHLFQRVAAVDDCHRWAFTLSAYNGGLGWVQRDKLQAQAGGYDPLQWWDNVERVSARARWAFDENRHYPRTILFKLQLIYRTWGPGIVCK